jgi:hypothetical protein
MTVLGVKGPVSQNDFAKDINYFVIVGSTVLFYSCKLYFYV